MTAYNTGVMVECVITVFWFSSSLIWRVVHWIVPSI